MIESFEWATSLYECFHKPAKLAGTSEVPSPQGSPPIVSPSPTTLGPHLGSCCHRKGGEKPTRPIHISSPSRFVSVASSPCAFADHSTPLSRLPGEAYIDYSDHTDYRICRYILSGLCVRIRKNITVHIIAHRMALRNTIANLRRSSPYPGADVAVPSDAYSTADITVFGDDQAQTFERSIPPTHLTAPPLCAILSIKPNSCA